MMRGVHSSRLTLGVIGHVDHGKTALVRALTGIDTDRLAEERRRGLSIVLGFAHLEASGVAIDLIDAPGHQAFIREMVAGATGFDGIVLVVAANEGLMPQTREHFGIARLLGIETGVIALTKADTVDSAVLKQRVEEIQAFTTGSFLEAADIVAVSAPSGEGIDALKRALCRLPARTEIADASPAYLPLDRVFTMQGFGVIGTGTLRGGPLRRNRALAIQPRGTSASIRGMQVHGADVETAHAGQRVAVNLRGVGLNDVRRGDVLAGSDGAQPTRLFDARIEILSDHATPVRNAQNVRLLIGTADLQARIRWLESVEVAPGHAGFAQLHAERDVVCVFGERFVIRSDSLNATIGGGMVLDSNARRHRRFDEAVAARLQARLRNGVHAVVAQQLETEPAIAMPLGALAAAAGVSESRARHLARECGGVDIDRGTYASQERLQRLSDEARDCIAHFHAHNPQHAGMSKSDLAAALGITPASVALDWTIARLIEGGAVVGTAAALRIAGFDPLAELTAAQRRLATSFLERARAAGLSGLDLTQAAEQGEPARNILRLLLDSRRLVRLQTKERQRHVVLHAEVIGSAEIALAEAFPYPAQFAVKDARDLLKSTRRCIVPLLEHFDAAGFTLRSGDLRQLRTSRR
jgi:selenocysteine-specific elongation factor